MFDDKEIILIKDAAVRLEETNLEMAYELMLLARKASPKNSFIKKKVSAYRNELRIDNSLVNIHLGVHKTATTYIQDTIKKAKMSGVEYIPLGRGRKIRESSGYFGFLKYMDFSKNVLISDENLIGGNGTILSGSLYPDFEANTNKAIRFFSNRDKLKLYITIRPMHSFLPSQYSEYLRCRYKFITFRDYMSKADFSSLSWFDILYDAINNNKDVSFYILDFNKFEENINIWLEQLSFGEVSSIDNRVKPSRASFSYNDLYQLSNGTLSDDYANNADKFRPFNKSDVSKSLFNYNADLAKLSSLSNVTLLP